MGRGEDPTLRIQVVAAVVLALCVAQTTWWIADQAMFTGEAEKLRVAALEADAGQAERLLAAGVPAEELPLLFPELELHDGRLRIRPEVLHQLSEERYRRVNRYGWEGSFFLAVLVGSLFVIGRTLRQHARLLRWQENFVAAVSHELKSPLASMRLAAETLSLRDPPPERRGQLVRRVLEELDRLETTTTNLLETRRLEEGAPRREPQRLDLAELAQRVVQTVTPSLEACGVKLVAELPRGLEFLADPVEVQIVISNLLDNAGKALSGAETPQVLISAEREGRWVRLRVRDNGVGFPPHESRRIFTKFYRLGDELRRTSRGVGLGLYLVRSLVEDAGGRIAAHSDGTGRGAEFEVRWPAAEPQPAG